VPIVRYILWFVKGNIYIQYFTLRNRNKPIMSFATSASAFFCLPNLGEAGRADGDPDPKLRNSTRESLGNFWPVTTHLSDQQLRGRLLLATEERSEGGVLIAYTILNLWRARMMVLSMH